jgi:hypothetical protein
MRQFGIICLIFFSIFFAFSSPVFADSARAYQDYLYQADQYRAKYNEFKVAKNEFDKFGTLTSQTTALNDAKAMMIQRDIMMKTYLTLLLEKISENAGLSPADKQLYSTLARNEIKFLDDHVLLANAIGSITDASYVSDGMTSHYVVLETSIEQIIYGMQLGSLSLIAGQFDSTVASIKSFVQENRSQIDSSKQMIIDRWLISIDNKRNLYQQNIDLVAHDVTSMKLGSQSDLDQKINQLTSEISGAKSYLSEGSSYIGELLNVIKSNN